MPSNANFEANERMRWDYLSDRKLYTRLRRIKKPEKLVWFMRLAMENGKADLFDAALQRVADLRVGHLSGIRQVVDECLFRRQDDSFTSRTPAWEEQRRKDEESEALRMAMTREAEKMKPKLAIRKIRF